MKKITLDFGGPLSAAAPTRRGIHEYIAARMEFPEYYGHNLDALYDCLTDITEPTAVGIVIPVTSEDPYIRKVRKAFADAETDNPNLAVFDLAEIPEKMEERLREPEE